MAPVGQVPGNAAAVQEYSYKGRNSGDSLLIKDVDYAGADITKTYDGYITAVSKLLSNGTSPRPPRLIPLGGFGQQCQTFLIMSTSWE